MKSLIITETPDTPFIGLDITTGKFIFKGNSIPENVHMFYEPILDWLDLYIENPQRKTIFNFEMKMISSSSSKAFFDILNKIDLLFEKDNVVVKVNWYYSSYDDEIREIGIDFRDSMKTPFELIIIE